MREGDEDRAASSDASGDSRSEKAVDESWKAQARREKDRLDEAPDPTWMRELPEASFLGLVEELSLRAVIALGQMPSPLTGQQELDLPAAKYTVDLLGVLEEKTKGNLSGEEAGALSELLQRLRMSYVYSAKHGPAAATRQGGGGAAGGGPEGGEQSGPRIIV